MDFGETCDLASVLPLIFSHFLSNWEGGGKKEGIKEKEMQQTWSWEALNRLYFFLSEHWTGYCK